MTKNKIVSSHDIYFSCMFPEDVITDQRVPRHVIMYIRSGKMLVTDHDRQLEFNAGQTVFIRRDHEVRVFKTGYDGMPYSAVSVIFDRTFLRDYFSRNVKHQKLPNHYPDIVSSAIILQDDSAVKSKLMELQQYIQADELPDAAEADLLKTEIVGTLLNENPDLYPVLFDFNEPWKIDILDFMERHFVANLSLEELASYTGRSLAGFKRDFAKISPLTPQKWLIRRRLEEALKMIVNEKYPVGDVATKCGFKNRTHFSRLFKEMFGVSPSEATDDTLYHSC